MSCLQEDRSQRHCYFFFQKNSIRRFLITRTVRFYLSSKSFILLGLKTDTAFFFSQVKSYMSAIMVLPCIF